jgi:hypothetical protein
MDARSQLVRAQYRNYCIDPGGGCAEYVCHQSTSMTTIILAIFALVIVGAAGAFVYVVSTDIRTDSDPISKR